MEKKTNEISLHSGHRNRLRDRVRKGGLKALSEHEIIELILNYAIPRVNTNPLAHKLINNFGSIAKVIDADYYDLLKVKGVGEEAALIFKVISSLMQVYRESKANDENIMIKNTLDSINYFRKRFEVDGKEFVHIIGLSRKGKLVTRFSFDGANDAEITFNFKTFMDKINTDNVENIIMFHTHPKGNAEPSLADLQTTQRCVYITSLMGLNFVDHIILTEDDFCSMQQRGVIETMKRNSQKLVMPFEHDDDLFDVKRSLGRSLNNIDLSNLDFGDISIEDKIKNKKK